MIIELSLEDGTEAKGEFDEGAFQWKIDTS